MRNFTLRTAFAGIFLCSSLITTAQKNAPPKDHRCGTMEVLNKIIQDDPSIVKRWQAEGQQQYQAWQQRKEDQSGQRVVNGEIIIPVVFHLVGAANVLNVISDRDIYDQLEILNRDFSGQKADKYKAPGVYAPEFASRIGNIPVRFVLARRTPAGTLTSGIQRLTTTKLFNRNIVNELKSTALGGLDPWDVSKYLNIWCASFNDGLLGIATFPFTNSPTIGPQGVAIDLGTLGANPCRGYYSPVYSEGATLSHEVGHFFYLWHTFGDNTACNNFDFRIQAGWPLTAAATNDDTPVERAVEGTMYGNLGGIFSDGCAVSPPGMMYMNFMNYYDDRSLFIFTKGQKERVTATLDMYRPDLRDSDADLPPTPITDAYLVSVSPAGNCVERLPVLNNTPLKATIRNYGTTTLTSITVTVQVNGGAVVPTTFPINLTPGKDTTLDAGLITGARGNQNIAVAVTSPNGGADAYPHNDNLITNVNIRDNYLTAPFTETFSGTFPPRLTTANDLWYVNGNYGTNTWSLSDANFNTKGAVVAPNYDYEEQGLFDELITAPIDFTTYDTSVLSFKVAYARYDNNTYNWDGLEVHASNDGGQSWFILYKKTGINLQTQTSVNQQSFDPGTTANLWRKEQINLTPYIGNGEKLILKFRNVNAYGNNLFIDDIGVTAISRTGSNAALTAIKSVPPALCNEFTIKPVATIENKATVALTTLKVNYSIDNGPVTTVTWNGNLAGNATADVALGTIANLTAGIHTLTVYTSNPNNTGDEDKSNDTLRTRFTIFTQMDVPITQGFESTTFPPTGWGVATSGTGPTWDRNTHASTEGVASAWVQNFRSVAGQVDRLFSPIVKTATYDSAYIRFDVAHATAVLPTSTTLPMDTLEVLVTTDCGATYTSVYKKWGAELQTMGDPNFVPQYDRANDLIGFIPNSATWRNEFLNITAVVAGKPEFQVIFKNSSNEGNNTFLDNINIYTVLLPEKLKKDGFVVYPNPFSGSFTIRHLQTPAGLKGITLVSASGQVVYKKNYSGNAYTFINIDGSGLASGVYTLRMVYNDKVVTQRIIKRPY